MDDEMFQTALRAFVAERVEPNIDAWERAGAYPASLHAEAGAARLLSLGDVPGPVPPIHQTRMRMLLEEVTRGGSQGLAVGLCSHFVSLSILASAGAEAFGSVIADVLAGARIIALALTEPDAGSDLTALDARAALGADGAWRITGEKRFICNGARAHCLVLGARAPDGLGLFLVEQPQAEIIGYPLEPSGWRCLPLAAIRFANARARLIAAPDRSGRILRGALTRERLNLAISAASAAEVVSAAVLKHSRSRLIRNAPLIAMTHVRQTLAELHTAVAMARHFVDRTTVEDGEVQVAMAKNAATAAFAFAAQIAVRLHGAAGCVSPSLAERSLRDAPLVAIGGGTTEVMNEIIARSLERRPE
ncbi:acyl-CoA dehydrogenase family protein [Methylosinus sp. H3A]|nr:acyl-CoA dehydrogenase family protein [Methylosinus sp. H3A]